MSITLQEVLAASTQKAADELTKAFLNLPEDKRDWSPDAKARTAMDQMAECAVLNGYTADLIKTKVWPSTGYPAFAAEKERLSTSWDILHAMLEENTEKLIETIKSVPDADLEIVIEIPWGSRTMPDTLSYSQWNMTYHLGQINYIASMLGVLK